MASKTRQESITWQEVSPGRFERDYDEMEKWYKAYGNCGEPYGAINARVTTICGYKTTQTDIVDVFRQAWGYMCDAHPHIACEIDGMRRIYDASTAEARKSQTFVIITDKRLRQVFTNLGQVRHPMLLVFPKEQKIMVHAPHSFSDGRGQFLFFSKFFDAVQAINEDRLASPSAQGSLQSRFAPAFNSIAAVGISDGTTERAGKYFADVEKYTDGIPAHNVDEVPPGRPSWVGLQFSETETSEVFRKIKERGMTVTTVAHAAVITASSRMMGKPAPYYGSIPVDLRRYCETDASQPLTVYVGVTMRLIEPGTFEELLERTKEAYSTIQDDYREGLMRAFGVTLASMAESEASYKPFPRFMVDLTNPGNIDQFIKPFYGDLEITSAKQQLQEEFYAIFTSLESFRGRLGASISYNDKYRKREEVERFATLFKEELLNGLGVKQDLDAVEALDPQDV